MLSHIILRSTAAFGGAPFLLKKCTALSSSAGGAAGGAAVGGVPGALVGDAANHGLTAYNTTRSVDASVSLQKSQENVNKSIEGVNKAQEGLFESQNDMQKMTYKFAMDTYQNRLLQEQFKAELENWRGFDAMYDDLIGERRVGIKCCVFLHSYHLPFRLIEISLEYDPDVQRIISGEL